MALQAPILEINHENIPLKAKLTCSVIVKDTNILKVDIETESTLALIFNDMTFKTGFNSLKITKLTIKGTKLEIIPNEAYIQRLINLTILISKGKLNEILFAEGVSIPLPLQFFIKSLELTLKQGEIQLEASPKYPVPI